MKEDGRMSSQPREHHKPASRALLELLLIVGIPSVLIYIISKIWK